MENEVYNDWVREKADARKWPELWDTSVQFVRQYCRLSELNYSGVNATFGLGNAKIHFRDWCFILVCLSECLL